ncbi:diguanylate cyclase [Gordonibacter sp. 28C]|uniref:nitroreductase family protein n=1 Tax=Gordonibacter sp. 28C TaxID=2078569 RepID=UPI000DF806FF|nr:nitroreductase [Gordonibacter sp. 28C]RDB60398.1 diguanylate cyclase [Gordonibacter sp. 28C]
MEAFDMLRNRRSIRKFKSDQVSEDALEQVLEAGLYAASGAGRQSAVTVVVQDPATVAKIDELNAKVLDSDQAVHPYYGAPTILVVLAPKDALTPTEDAVLMAGNMLNAAYAAGLGSCWIHRSKEVFEMPEGKELLRAWGLPEDMAGVSSIALGYADCPQPEAAPRKEGRVVRA